MTTEQKTHHRVLQLPSGHTWTLNINPPWGQLKRLREGGTAEETLALITVGWSFPEPPSAAVIDGLDAADVVEALAVFNTEVLPLFRRLAGKLSSA